MDKLISSRIIVQSVQPSYILPPDRRPGDWVVPICTNIPVIDLEGDLDCNHADIIQKILELINHDVSENSMHDVLMVEKEFLRCLQRTRLAFYCCRSKAKLYAVHKN